MRKTVSGYEVTIRGFIPASPDEPFSIIDAMQAMDGTIGDLPIKMQDIDLTYRYVHRRRRHDLPADAAAQLTAEDLAWARQEVGAILKEGNAPAQEGGDATSPTRLSGTYNVGPGEARVAGADTKSGAAGEAEQSGMLRHPGVSYGSSSAASGTTSAGDGSPHAGPAPRRPGAAEEPGDSYAPVCKHNYRLDGECPYCSGKLPEWKRSA